MAAHSEVSTVRLYVLRATYLLVFLGLAMQIWPLLLTTTQNYQHMRSVVHCLLAAVSLLALLGIRYPLKMLPVLFFELIWKVIWFIAVALPIYRTGTVDAATRATVFDCIPTIILLLVMPWGYVWRTYVTASGDRWGKARTAESEG